MKNLVSILDLTKAQINDVLELAQFIKQKPESVSSLLKGKVIACCFFEASTRTRLSFESAIYRLGGNVIGFSEPGSTSFAKKGESFEDTIKVIGGYADALIIRHPEVGTAHRAQSVLDIPVINAGDGANQHPTQTLLDLFTIQEHHKKLTDLHITFVGDLKYSRTVHSLIEALSLYEGISFDFVSPLGLELPEKYKNFLEQNQINFSELSKLESMASETDVIYITRVQKERIQKGLLSNYQPLILNEEIIKKVKTNACILHPLPRQEELPENIDYLPQAKYFEQARNGIYVRQALLVKLLGLGRCLEC